MKHIKLFEDHINENLAEERIAETYFWLRYMGYSNDEIIPVIRNEFDLGADDIDEIKERFLDDHDIDPKDEETFISNPPAWFVEWKLDKDPKYVELHSFLKNQA